VETITHEVRLFSSVFLENVYVKTGMKTKAKPNPIFCFLTACMVLLAMPFAKADPTPRSESPDDNQRIMLALLLDTSNSMDGLIEQAKSQLWRIVNELAAAKCPDGRKPSIKIALYEYGNDGLPSSEGYIRQVSGMTDDLDLISEKLFSLRTNGGNEFCGQVIKTSLRQLAWSESRADLKLIFIAGNEPFTQGPVPYRLACDLAREKDVIVNTIFCGNHGEGIETSWKNGADLTGGNYMSIEQDQRTVYIVTPFDERISRLNDELNDTYIYYGASGYKKKEMQSRQDSNAESYGQANKVERTLSKSSHAYKNSTWDLVDATKENEKVIEQTQSDELPEEMKRMSVEQRKTYVKEKSTRRASIQKQIAELGAEREKYIRDHAQDTGETSLDAVMIKAVRTQAKAKNLSW
jgi:hypothetical protein